MSEVPSGGGRVPGTLRSGAGRGASGAGRRVNNGPSTTFQPVPPAEPVPDHLSRTRPCLPEPPLSPPRGRTCGLQPPVRGDPRPVPRTLGWLISSVALATACRIAPGGTLGPLAFTTGSGSRVVHVMTVGASRPVSSCTRESSSASSISGASAAAVSRLSSSEGAVGATYLSR